MGNTLLCCLHLSFSFFGSWDSQGLQRPRQRFKGVSFKKVVQKGLLPAVKPFLRSFSLIFFLPIHDSLLLAPKRSEATERNVEKETEHVRHLQSPFIAFGPFSVTVSEGINCTSQNFTKSAFSCQKRVPTSPQHTNPSLRGNNKSMMFEFRESVGFI